MLTSLLAWEIGVHFGKFNGQWYENYIHKLVLYEGCHSKLWTFVIKRDLSGYLRNLPDMLKYIYETLSSNMDEFTVSITKL